MAHRAKADHTSLRTVLWRWPVAAAWAAIVAVEAAVFAFIKRKGVSVTGDEPHYLISAKALTKFSVHPLPTYQVDLRTHQLFHWAAGTQPTNLTLQLYTGPHGAVSTHPLGLSALMAPFVALGGARLARLGLMAIEAAGFLYFAIRAADLAGLSRQAKVVLAIVMASPALWVAATQIYPDLLTGIVMACALVDLVAFESRHRLDLLATGVSALSLALLPWLHQQNLVGAVFILVALAVVARAAHRWWTFVVIAVVSLASWLLLLAYNLYDYGHALGLPQPFPSLNKAGITDILGLLLDRHQGIFVQVPLAALGLIGLWLARRVAPLAAIATLASAASLIYLNGTFIHAPYGGASFAGRFQWSAIPPLLAWCPFLIAWFQDSKARLWGLGALAALLWALELVPIIRGDHVYYNQLAAAPPWDPAGYAGWWGRFDRLLPEMIPGSRLLGRPWFGFPIALALLVLIVVAGAGLARFHWKGTLGLGAVTAAAAVAAVVLATSVSFPLPTSALAFTDQDIGGPIQSGPSVATTPVVALQGVGAGGFRITVDYVLQGNQGSATLLSYCTHGTTGQPQQQQTSSTTLGPATHRATMTLRCPTGTVWFQMTAQPATALAVSQLTLAKTSS